LNTVKAKAAAPEVKRRRPMSNCAASYGPASQLNFQP